MDTIPTHKPIIHRHLITILNCLLLSLGNSGGPIFLRLYFLHGGRRPWLPSFLQTAAFPLLLVPLVVSHIRRRRTDPSSPLIHLSPPLLLASSVLGILTGLDDFLYARGLAFLPVSSSAVLVATQLAFTALFAFLIVNQKFNFFSVNAVALLTVGAAALALRGGGDEELTRVSYWKGFGLTLGAAALYGLILPLVELTYERAGRAALTYSVVVEMQFVNGFFATVFCAGGMIFNKDFQAIPGEAAEYGLGETKYYLVIIGSAIFWQCFFLGAVGVISCANTLLAGVIIAVFIPVIELLAVIFLHENFSKEKGLALVLSLWGLASYSYGEYRHMKEEKKRRQETTIIVV